jgi:hypothetical protein
VTDKSVQNDQARALQQALMLATPGLSRFDPLPRLITYDDFSNGYCGWSQLVGNYEETLDTMLPGYAQHSSPMLSTLSHWDAGSHGAMSGSYALKLATRPKQGAQNVAIKRLTFRKPTPIRFEAYVTYKPEASELKLGDQDLRSFGFLFDLQHGHAHPAPERVMPHFRFLNAHSGTRQERWQFKQGATEFVEIGDENKTRSHYHLSDDGWSDLPGGAQRLCYNEIATKVNWIYLCLDFDLEAMRPTRFQCNDQTFDISDVDSIRMPAMHNLWNMLNFAFFVETDTDKRALLYVDSVCISGGL